MSVAPSPTKEKMNIESKLISELKLLNNSIGFFRGNESENSLIIYAIVDTFDKANYDEIIKLEENLSLMFNKNITIKIRAANGRSIKEVIGYAEQIQ